jgi:putative endonuclease
MRQEKYYYVYILSNKRNGTLYIGVTNSLLRRTSQHKLKNNKNSFSSKYNTVKLVYYEIYGTAGKAIYREKCMKKWNRDWKIRLIEKQNPMWRDLFHDME